MNELELIELLTRSLPSNDSVIGGTGDATLSATGGSNITLFGSSGNSTMSSSGGSNVSLSGGSGNARLPGP